MQYGQEVTKSSKEFPKLYQLHGGEIITLPPHLSNQICPNQLESLLLYRLPTKVGGNNRATSLIQQPTITFNPHSFPSPYTPNNPFTNHVPCTKNTFPCIWTHNGLPCFKDRTIRKNLALKTWWQSESGLLIIHQTSLANKASLNSSISLNFIPPTSLASQSLSNLTQWVFLEPPLYPHQNLIMTSLSLIKPLGSLKQLIVYVGIACMTDLISTSIPTWDNSFSFYPWNFFQTLSFI